MSLRSASRRCHVSDRRATKTVCVNARELASGGRRTWPLWTARLRFVRPRASRSAMSSPVWEAVSSRSSSIRRFRFWSCLRYSAAFFWRVSRAGSGAAPSALDRQVCGQPGVGLLIAVVFGVLFGYFIVFEALVERADSRQEASRPSRRTRRRISDRSRRFADSQLDSGWRAAYRLLHPCGDQRAALLRKINASATSPPERSSYATRVWSRRAHRSSGATSLLYAPTRYLNGDERALIKRFLDRRKVLAADRRKELAAQLAARVRARVPEELSRLDDEPLLERL